MIVDADKVKSTEIEIISKPHNERVVNSYEAIRALKFRDRRIISDDPYG